MILDYLKSVKSEINDVDSMLKNGSVFNKNIITSSIDSNTLSQLNMGYTSDGQMTSGYSNAIEKLASSYNEATAEANALKMAQDGLSESTAKDILVKQNWSKAEIDAAISSNAFKTAQTSSTGALNADTSATWANVVATKALSTVKKTLSIVGGIAFATAISVGVTALVKFTDSLITTKKELKEASEASKQAINDIKTSFDNLETTTSSIKERYAELAQSIDQLNGKNISLSDNEYKEFLDISNQLAELFPSLTKNYDENGNAILDLSGNVDTIVGSLNDIVEAERLVAQQDILKELPNVYAELSDNISEYQKQIKNYDLLKDVVPEDYFINNLGNMSFDLSKGNNVVSANLHKYLKQQLKDGFKEVGLEDVGVSIDYNYADSGYELNLNNLENTEEYYEKLNKVFINVRADITKNIQELNSSVETEASRFNQYIYTWLSQDPNYSKMNDNLKKAMQQLLFNSNWFERLPNNIDSTDWKQVSIWLEENYLNAINDIDSEVYKQKLSDLFTADLSPQEKVDLAKKLQAYFDENDIKISLDFILDEEDPSSESNLVSRVTERNEQIAGSLEEHNILKQYFKDNSIDTDEEYNIWLDVTKKATDATDAIKKYEKALNQIPEKEINFFTEDNLESIDAYKNKISDLSTYLQSINDKHELSANEIAVLNTEYGIYADSVEGYKQAIVDLMNETVNSSDIMIALSEAIESCSNAAEKERLQTLYDALKKIGIEAIETTDNLYNLESAISELESAASLLRDVNESMENNGYIDSSQLSKILNVYPQLAEKVAEYNAGLIDSQELFKALTEAYEEDQKNYSIAVANKLKDNEEFFKGVVSKLPDWVKKLAEAYNIDFKNYKSLVEAKLRLEKELAEKRNILESATTVNDQIVETADNSFGKDIMSLHAYNNLKKVKQDYSKTKNELDAYKKIIESVDTTMTTTIDLDTSWKSFGKDPSSDSNNGKGSDSSGNEFSNEIDWIENSLSNVNREIDSINEKIGHTKGFKERIALYKKLNKANQELVDATSKAVDAYENEWIKASSKISSAYKNKIISGNTFTVEEFSNEALYNNVSAAKEAYEQWQSSIQNHNQALIQQKEDQDSYTEILLEQSEIKLDIISLDIEEADTAKQKNKLLNREKELKKEILGYNLSLADSEEEKLRLQKEYNSYLKENEKAQYNNTRQEINNKVDFYDSYIQDIQNAIELAEAKNEQATALQYKEINNYLGRQIELEQINYNNALNKRNNAEWGSDEWTQYNNEIQEAQDKIKSCTVAQIENNKAILLLPVQKYEDLNEELQKELDILNEYKGKVENAIGYASTLIQDQIDILNDNKESVSDYWDEQIEAIQNERDALTESNDELQRQIDLENAKYNLEKAMNNKTVRIYRKNEGFVYESDQSAIRDAQQELDNLEYNNAVNNLDKTIETLEKQKENELSIIDEQIESWEKYAEKIDRVTSSYENFMAMQDLIQVFGSTAISDILNKDEEIISNFEFTLNSVKTDVDEIQQKIEANDILISSIQQKAEAFASSSISIVEAQNEVKQAIIENKEEILAIEQRRNIAKELSTTWSQTKEDITTALSTIEELNISTKDTEFETLSERIKNLQDFEVQATSIYSKIINTLNKAKSAMNSLNSLNGVVLSSSSSAGSSTGSKKSAGKNKSVTSTGDLPTYHTGGIVGNNSNHLPENLIALTDPDLKPNEVIAKLLNREVVLNQPQMNNLFDNLGRTYTSFTPVNPNNNNGLSVTIGDVNVYNPDNSDMIVNEIVKELPLKIIQKLNSK